MVAIAEIVPKRIVSVCLCLSFSGRLKTGAKLARVHVDTPKEWPARKAGGAHLSTRRTYQLTLGLSAEREPDGEMRASSEMRLCVCAIV